MNLEEIKERVVHIIDMQVWVERDCISENALVKEDLGFDSIDCVEVIMEIEKEFSISIPDNLAENVRLVSDYYKLVENELLKKE